MNETIPKLRERYKPKKIKVLFVAESPPESSDKEVRFFYNPVQERWDHMYRSVMKAVFRDFEYRRGEKDAWLSKFRESGYYLIDATDSPVNRLSSKERRRVLNAAVKEKVSEIAALVSKRTPIILVKKNVFAALGDPLRLAGYNVAHDEFLPFPSHSHQPRFIEACRKCLGAAFAKDRVPMITDGKKILAEVVADLRIDLSQLVAGAAFWAPNDKNIGVAKYPNVRRAKASEKRGDMSDGVRLDDNTYANQASKKALCHLGKFNGFTACHIWPGTCYDERYHTVLANLVLLPSALSSLTDHNTEIEKCLQYRSWKLYRWYPDGKAKPSRPKNYPENWRQPEQPPDSTKRKLACSSVTSGKSGSGKALPISLVPADKAKFREALVQSGGAQLFVTYSDGRVEECDWICKSIGTKSNILKNLRSRPKFRKGQWQQLGIEKVEARIAEVGARDTSL